MDKRLVARFLWLTLDLYSL